MSLTSQFILTDIEMARQRLSKDVSMLDYYYDGRDGISGQCCITGDKYVVVASGIDKNPIAAVYAWQKSFANYVLSGRPGTLYWNIRPELREIEGGYIVYSRFVMVRCGIWEALGENM